jgi:hypothetical protein
MAREIDGRLEWIERSWGFARGGRRLEGAWLTWRLRAEVKWMRGHDYIFRANKRGKIGRSIDDGLVCCSDHENPGRDLNGLGTKSLSM